jgi:hypothetical protein
MSSIICGAAQSWFVGATAKKPTTMETLGGLLDSSGEGKSVIHIWPKERKIYRARHDAVSGEIEQTTKCIQVGISHTIKDRMWELHEKKDHRGVDPIH